MHERERSSPAACSIIVPVGAKSMIFGRDVDNNVPKIPDMGPPEKIM